eukprot:TRINITY_DN5766_c0_g1_i1.p1 TRINITY_DN5766_c0_g1~~TRINITY_DN5766_c0_g1_i1.p1  ORF type:complete len:1263 (+),score=376.65 TRINITY_DN5766_c0_g1_i1:126-3791(+)
MGGGRAAALLAGLQLCGVARGYSIGTLWPQNSSSFAVAGLLHGMQAAVVGHRAAIGVPSFTVSFPSIGNYSDSSLSLDAALAALLRQGDLVGMLSLSTTQTIQNGITASRLQLPLMAPIATGTQLQNRGEFSYVRNVLPSNEAQAASMVAVVQELARRNRVDLKRIAALAYGNAYGIDLLQSVITAATAARVRIDTVQIVEDAQLQDSAAFANLFLAPLHARSTQCILVLAPTSAETGPRMLLYAAQTGYFADRVWLASEPLAATSADVMAAGLPGGSVSALNGLLGVRPVQPRLTDLGDSFASDWASLGASSPPSLAARATYLATRALLAAASGTAGVTPYTETCSPPDTPWPHGPALMAHIDGGAFSPSGLHQNAAFEVVNLQPDTASTAGFSWVPIGNVSAQNGTVEMNEDQIVWNSGFVPSSEDVLRGRTIHILFVEDPRGIPMCLRRDSVSTTNAASFQHYCGLDGVYPQPSGKKLCGFIPDLVDRLAQDLGFNYTWTSQVGGWGGAMTELSNADSPYDMVASSSPVTSEREELVDFTFPYLTTSYALFVKHNLVTDSLWRFLSPFTWGVWLMFAACLAVFSVAFYLLERNYNQYLSGAAANIYSGKVASLGGMNNAFWFSFTSLFAVQDGAPVTHAGRLATAGYFVVTFMFAATYTAELLRFLQKKAGTSFAVESVNDFEGIGTDEDDTVGTKPLSGLVVDAGGVYERWVRDNTFNASGYQVSPGGINSFRAVSNGTAKATIFFKLYATYAREVTNCTIDLAPADLVGSTLGLGLALKRGSLLRSGMSNAIVQLQGTGWIDDLKRHWLQTSVCAAQFFSSENDLEGELVEEGMQIEAVGGVFIVFAAFLGIAILMRLSRIILLPLLPESCQQAFAIETVEHQEKREQDEHVRVVEDQVGQLLQDVVEDYRSRCASTFSCASNSPEEFDPADRRGSRQLSVISSSPDAPYTSEQLLDSPSPVPSGSPADGPASPMLSVPQQRSGGRRRKSTRAAGMAVLATMQPPRLRSDLLTGAVSVQRVMSPVRPGSSLQNGLGQRSPSGAGPSRQHSQQQPRSGSPPGSLSASLSLSMRRVESTGVHSDTVKGQRGQGAQRGARDADLDSAPASPSALPQSAAAADVPALDAPWAQTGADHELEATIPVPLEQEPDPESLHWPGGSDGPSDAPGSAEIPDPAEDPDTASDPAPPERAEDSGRMEGHPSSGRKASYGHARTAHG